MLDVVRRVATDRFVIFIILGVGLFALDAYTREDPSRIVVSADDIAMLEGRWQAQSGAEPDAEQLASLVDFHVREEILVREARRLGLDRDDVILRRRLAQKMDLLIRDRLTEPVITSDALKAHYDANPDRYAEPRRVGFRHIFLGSADGDVADDAQAIKAALAEATDPDAWRRQGQPFMLARSFGLRTRADLIELFGAPFAERLMAEEGPRAWWGPVRSSYGWHLVETVVVEDRHVPPLEAVRERVAGDLRRTLMDAQEAEAWTALQNRYTVDLDPGTP